MAKSKTPFLSLGSQGTVASSLTSQRHARATLLRQKPIPTNPRTLPQTYQRWLYEDYAYLWRQQSLATRAEYRTAGSRYHLTGYQYWMKYNLQNLPDIAGMWHLDEKAGAVARDTSRNANHGSIVGFTPTDGPIDGAFSFDGITDRITVANHPSLYLTGACTIEYFIKAPPYTGSPRFILSKRYSDGDGAQGFWAYLDSLTDLLYFSRMLDGAVHVILSPFSLNAWCHIATTYDGSFLRAYLNGTPLVPPRPHDFTIKPFTDLSIASYNALFLSAILLDNLILYKRALDPTEVKRHSLRRYPLQ